MGERGAKHSLQKSGSARRATPNRSSRPPPLRVSPGSDRRRGRPTVQSAVRGHRFRAQIGRLLPTTDRPQDFSRLPDKRLGTARAALLTAAAPVNILAELAWKLGAGADRSAG